MSRSGIKSKLFLFICCLCLCLAGCSAADIPQPTKAELLAEVNAEHQAIQWEEVDPESYLRTEPEVWNMRIFSDGQDQEKFDREKTLTHEQAVEDVDYLFEAFSGGYALYDYLGGKEVFDAAQQAILQELDGKETLTCEELQNILVEKLDFIEDGHVAVNMIHPAPKKVPFFFRETTFIKTETGYQTTDGKIVQSVDGHADLDELFKRSISKEGKLVYYPVVLEDGECHDLNKMGMEEQICSETLTVRYEDGTSEELTAEPYTFYWKSLPEGQNTDLRQEGDIPVFQFNNFRSEYGAEILESADVMKEAPISILDLRSNGGGVKQIVHDWLKAYSGKTVPTNGLWVDVFNDIQYTRQRGTGGEGRQVSNENTLIILTSKFSASSAEIFLDSAVNLENVLIIGENTSGAMVGGAGNFTLPNSKCLITMSLQSAFITSENNDKFEELRGFYPDIWVPAGEAEELAAKLMEQLK